MTASARIRTTEANPNLALASYGSKPKTTTAFGVPAYTLPLAIIGVTNLSFELDENWSRAPA